MTIIEQIKAEIERLKGKAERRPHATPLDGFEGIGKIKVCNELLSFLSTLESEKPTNQSTRQRLAEWSKTPEGRAAYEKVAEEMRREISEKPMQEEFEADLEKEIKDTCRSYRINESHEQELGKQDIENIARHFAQWQKQHDAELIEIAYNDGITIGMTKQKEQMMENGNVILAEEDFDAEKEKSMERGYNLCKEQIMKEAVKWLVDDDYDELTDKGRFILGSVGIGYNGYYIPYSDLLKLPKEGER
jgi:hypothetical protein